MALTYFGSCLTPSKIKGPTFSNIAAAIATKQSEAKQPIKSSHLMS